MTTTITHGPEADKAAKANNDALIKQLQAELQAAREAAKAAAKVGGR